MSPIRAISAEAQLRRVALLDLVPRGDHVPEPAVARRHTDDLDDAPGAHEWQPEAGDLALHPPSLVRAEPPLGDLAQVRVRRRCGRRHGVRLDLAARRDRRLSAQACGRRGLALRGRRL